MSPYFKEYILRIFKRHSRDFYITFILYFITMYFVSIQSEYASGVGMISLFVLIFIKRFESKTLAQNNLNSRSVESSLLPFSAKEMFYAQLIKTAMTMLPVYVVLMGIASTFLFNDTKIPLFQFVCYESMVVLLLVLINATASLRVSFVKIKTIHKLTSITRFMNYTFIFSGVVLTGFVINKFYKTNLPAILICFFSLFVFIVYLGGNVERLFLHEHKIHNNKRFKWFDIPGMVIIVFAIVSSLYSITHPARSPSSISKETIRK